MEKSMLDIAYEIIGKSKNGVQFNELFTKVLAEKGFGEDKIASLIGRFYSDLSLDGRFVVRDNNTWDLRERYKYDDVHVKLDNAYEGVESSSGDEEDKAEDIGYEAEVQGISVEELENAPTEEPAEGQEGENTAA